jgi:hypothetical protein
MDNLNISASITPIDPSSLFSDGFELQDQDIIPNLEIPGAFDPELNDIELFIYDYNLNLLYSNYEFSNWKYNEDNNNLLELYPIHDAYNRGFTNGILYNVYNFINLELNSSFETPYYVSEISSDRTEIRIKSNFLTNEEIEFSYIILKNKIESSDYFDEFYISFGNNEYHIGVNVLLDTSLPQYSILIKLYDDLPTQYSIKDTLYVVTKVVESQAYKIDFKDEFIEFNNLTYLKGPNVNIPLQDSINNSTEFKSKSSLLETTSSGSLSNLLNRLNRKGVKLTPFGEYFTHQPDNFFNDFKNFVFFSSAKERILNFIQKVRDIETLNTDIKSLSETTNNINQVQDNLKSLELKIQNIKENFDRYEHYLYYASTTFSYPKSNSTYPYDLRPVDSLSVQNWLSYILDIAEKYDENNQNWLFYVIPEFIRENEDNQPYIQFCNMVGQHFDEVWLYTKYITEKLNTTNELYSGVPLELAKNTIESLGWEVFGNNFNSQDLFLGLVGEENGSYVPSVGKELIPILNYIAVNLGFNLKYWEDKYSCDYYVERLQKPGFPYSIDDVSKEIYKRLYHNMVNLLKRKGTYSGLRQLINIWGVPSTILRISEFGGKNKNNLDNYDYWYKRYNYSFNTSPSTEENSGSFALIPWMPLYRNWVDKDLFAGLNSGSLALPSAIQFRFKTEGIPTETYYTQSLLVKKSNSTDDSTVDFGIVLEYIPPFPLALHSGSVSNGKEEWGNLYFYMGSGSNFTIQSDPINLPFFNKDWWGVTLTRSNHVSASINNTLQTYTLYVGNKIYNQNEGNQIGFEGNTSILSVNENLSNNITINQSWQRFGTGSLDGVYLGGLLQGSSINNNIISPPGILFSGSFQEFRYYSRPLNINIFKDYVMNPESIEGFLATGSESSFGRLNFRADLGNELDYEVKSLYKGNKIIRSIPEQSHIWSWGGRLGLPSESFSNNNNISGLVRHNPPIQSSPEFLFNVTSSMGENTTCFHEIAQTYLRNTSGNTIELKMTSNENSEIFYIWEIDNIGSFNRGEFNISLSGSYVDNWAWRAFRFLRSGSNSPFLESDLISPLQPTGSNIFPLDTEFIFSYTLPETYINPEDEFFTENSGGLFERIFKSIHPAVTSSFPSLVVDSFYNPGDDTFNSDYKIIVGNKENYFKPNVEDYFLDQPIVGLKNRISSKIQIEENFNYGKVLSNQISIQQNKSYNRYYIEDTKDVEVVFSPQNEINDDIDQTLGFSLVQEILGDPKYTTNTDPNYYSGLKKIADFYFKKYKKGNIYDYLRLVKYYDNSLFKSIKKYVPARTGIVTGILIKQHKLERNRHTIFTPLIENVTIEGGINIRKDILQVEGGAGGSVNKYNKI